MATNGRANRVTSAGREALTFELGMDDECLVSSAPADIEHIGLAADLAVFDVALMAAGGFIDEGLIPLSAAGALKVRIS
jgi:hypothetical protein